MMIFAVSVDNLAQINIRTLLDGQMKIQRGQNLYMQNANKRSAHGQAL
jgi:hypothetical protein